MTTGRTLSLSHLSFDLLWTTLDLGSFPLVLQLSSHGETMPEREQLFAEDRTHLIGLGVLLRDGQVHPEVVTMLITLAHPDVEVDARASSAQGGLRALAATRGSSTVLAVRTDTTVSLTPVSPGSLALSVITALPAHRPAPRAQVSGRSTDVESALGQLGGRGDGALRAFTSLGATQEQARTLTDGLRSVFAMTRIGVAVRDEYGHRQRHPFVVAVLDSGAGRWMTTQRAGHDNVPWTTVRQASTDDVRSAVTEMLAPKATGVLR